MRTTIQIRNIPVGDAVYNASRQVWLAGLGAAVVTREWAQADAGKVFRNLVKEGTAVESRTFRLVGDRLEGSFTRANALWRQTRRTVSQRVRKAADNAVTLVQANLPRALPKVTLPAMLMPAKAPAKKRAAGKRTAKARTAKVAKVAKRGTRARKAATK
ncbi:MAG: phasin family protein [Burkholderiales bacterium]